MSKKFEFTGTYTCTYEIIWFEESDNVPADKEKAWLVQFDKGPIPDFFDELAESTAKQAISEIYEEPIESLVAKITLEHFVQVWKSKNTSS